MSAGPCVGAQNGATVGSTVSGSAPADVLTRRSSSVPHCPVLGALPVEA